MNSSKIKERKTQIKREIEIIKNDQEKLMKEKSVGYKNSNKLNYFFSLNQKSNKLKRELQALTEVQKRKEYLP